MLEVKDEGVNEPLWSKLQSCPTTAVNEVGHPRFGTYCGALDEVNLDALRGPYRLPVLLRALKHKRWQYGMIATDEVLAVFSIADLTYTANAFATAVDLRKREMLFDESSMGAPLMAVVGTRPGRGAQSKFSGPLTRLSFARALEGQDRYELSVRLRRQRVQWDAMIDINGAGPPLTVIAPVPKDGVVNVTQKWAALPVSGTLKVADKSFSLANGRGGLDYSHGYLARHTAWRWAFATGRLEDETSVGLNLVEGFNEASDEANENVLWLGQRLIPLGRAQFVFEPKDVSKEWKVTTHDKTVELIFQPIYSHREERNYGVVKSHFVQPLGIFRGEIRLGKTTIRLPHLAGVVEDQDVLW